MDGPHHTGLTAMTIFKTTHAKRNVEIDMNQVVDFTKGTMTEIYIELRATHTKAITFDSGHACAEEFALLTTAFRSHTLFAFKNWSIAEDPTDGEFGVEHYVGGEEAFIIFEWYATKAEAEATRDRLNAQGYDKTPGDLNHYHPTYSDQARQNECAAADVGLYA